jgi:hypothetical protein
MDPLKREAEGHFGGKGFVRRSELEQKHILKRRDDYRGKPNESSRDAIETRKWHKATVRVRQAEREINWYPRIPLHDE